MIKPTLFSKLKLATMAVSLAFSGSLLASPVLQGTSDQEITDIAKEAYIYSVAPTYSYQFLFDEVFNKDSNNYIGAFNTFRHYQRFNTPEDTMITPAVDFFYSRAWLDLRNGPIAITVPKLTPDDRYYVLQAISLDHYNLDFFGTRTGGQEGGTVLYVGPNYKGDIPDGKYDRIVKADSDIIYMQLRVQTKDEQDAKSVIKWQDQLSIKDMQGSIASGKSAENQKNQFIEYTNRDESIYTPKIYEYLPFLLEHISLDLPNEQEMVKRFAKIGIEAGDEFDLSEYDKNEQQAIKKGFKQGVTAVNEALKNVRTSVGVLGSKQELNFNYVNRATGALAGVFGNSPDEAMYFGKQMDVVKAGENYVLHFPANAIPPVKDKGFWSITMYNYPDRLLVDNELNRYSLGDRSENMKFNKDGSLDIYMQSEAPSEDKMGNWLPTPKEGPFWYVIRLYIPEQAVISGDWKAPTPQLNK